MSDLDRIIVDNLGWIRKAARRYCRNRESAEDLAGDAVYKMLKSKARYDPSKGFRPWALAIIQNTYITDYNRRRLMAASDLAEASDRAASDRADGVAGFRAAVGVLRDCARKSVCIGSVLLYAKGYSYEEIADIEGIGVGTVKSRISSGRKMIAQALAG